MIAGSQVMVYERLASLGMKADAQIDQIEVNGKPVGASEPLKYIALHKPRNVISATSPQDNRKTVCDLVKEAGALYPVGRLDVDSEGLILLTNDGGLADWLTYPRYQHDGS